MSNNIKFVLKLQALAFIHRTRMIRILTRDERKSRTNPKHCGSLPIRTKKVVARTKMLPLPMNLIAVVVQALINAIRFIARIKNLHLCLEIFLQPVINIT